MVYDTARRLAGELRNCEEYTAYCTAREKAMEDDATRTLLNEYHRLQIQAQAAMVAGGDNKDMLAKLQKLGELLQFNADASTFLMAEFRMNRMLSDVYKLLAEAVNVDLSALEV